LTTTLSFGRRHIYSRAFSRPRRRSSASTGALGFDFLERDPAFYRARLKVLALSLQPVHIDFGLRQRPVFSDCGGGGG